MGEVVSLFDILKATDSLWSLSLSSLHEDNYDYLLYSISLWRQNLSRYNITYINDSPCVWTPNEALGYSYFPLNHCCHCLQMWLEITFCYAMILRYYQYAESFPVLPPPASWCRCWPLSCDRVWLLFAVNAYSFTLSTNRIFKFVYFVGRLYLHTNIFFGSCDGIWHDMWVRSR